MDKSRICLRTFCIFIALILAFGYPFAVLAANDSPNYVRTVFNKTNGLPTDEANAVLQANDGYLWVASYGGLLRYDGTNFRNFSNEGAISTPSVRALFQDSRGRLWIGSSDAGVFCYENDKFTAIPCTDKYGFLSIRDFAEDKNGKIYVASTSGVCEISNGTMIPLDDPQVSGETVYSVGIDAYNRLWCAVNAEKCVILQDNRCAAVLTGNDFFDGGKRITCLASDSSGNIYIGTNSNVIAKIACNGAALDGSDFSVRIFNTKDAVYHNRIGITDSGGMLISGEQGFAYMTADGEEIDSGSPSRTDAVNWATVDYEGDVWLASSNEGLVRYTPGYFATPNYTAGLSGRDVNAVTEAGGLYYVATDTGLLAFNGDWQPVNNALTEMLDGIHVKQLTVDSKGQLWSGTYSDFGIVRYNPGNGEIFSFNTGNGLKSTRVHVSYEMTDGTMAVGTQDGLALIKDNTVTAFYDKKSGMETQSVLCIAQAPNGTLLAGSAGSGIYAIKQNGELTRYSYEQGLDDGVVLRIVPTSNGNSSFVSAGSHLYYWSDGKFSRFDNLSIGAGSIFDIFEREEKLWLIQDSGLYSVNTESLLAGEQTHAARYSTSDGLTGSISVNTWNYTAPDGRLYLSTRNGISIFDFRVMEYRMPELVINSVRVDNRIYEHPETVRLDKSNRRMTISFSALTFSGTADLCIAYQLVGFAKKETVIYGTSGSVSYTTLDGGTYTFRLRVYDPDNPEIQENIEFTVIKEKKLSEYPIVWVAGISAIILITLGFSHFIAKSKFKRLQEQREMYQNIVRQALRTFANAIDVKDPYINGHSVRVAFYAREIARRLGYPENDQERIYYIALLHDIGKIGIPDSILQKNGTLTPEEYKIIQTHPIKGNEILHDFTALKGLSDGVLYHHERYDGKGYCSGLAGEGIPMIGRIVCVADCYDAMSTDRCYRKRLSTEEILEELKSNSGTQFDPRIAKIMTDMIREGVVPISASDSEQIFNSQTSAPDSKKAD